MIYIDFETRSRVDLKKVGAWVYSLHPSTEILCMAWAVDDGPVQIWSPEMDLSFPSGHNFEAHNAFFEKSIWQNIMVDRHQFSEIPYDQWHCSAALCAAHSLPRGLDAACKALDLPVQKNMDGHKLMLKMSKPRKPTKNDQSEWHEKFDDYEKLLEYCRDDVRAERALSKALRPLSTMEREVWLLDQKINMRGVRVDVAAARAAHGFATGYTEKIASRLPFVTHGEVKTPGQIAKIRKFCSSRGVELEGLSKDIVAEALAGDLPDVVRDVLEIRSLLGKSSVKKYDKILQSVAPDERIRDLLMYHGAGTGRWSGKGFQPQNLPRNNFTGDTEQYFEILKDSDLDTFEFCYEEVMDTISSNIRGCLIPSEGMTMFGGDYRAIEARVVLWLAGDERALQVFRDGGDIYIDLAKTIYGKQKISKEERFLGKQGVLGCGYQMGAKKFQDTCAGYGVEISLEVAKKVVTAYREKYHKVAALWRTQETAVKEAITTGNYVKRDGIGWGKHEDFLYCKLPSGRLIAYYDPKLEIRETSWGENKLTITYMAVDSQTKKWVRTSSYGGKIVENVVQGIARDLMAHAMLKIEANGFDVLLTIHDEIIAEAENGTIKNFEALMESRPDWALTIPTEVEGWSGKRYLK